jgi:hypothetical protein
MEIGGGDAEGVLGHDGLIDGTVSLVMPALVAGIHAFL